MKGQTPESSYNESEPCTLRNNTICAGNDILIEHAAIPSRDESLLTRSFDASLPVDTFFRQGRAA